MIDDFWYDLKNSFLTWIILLIIVYFYISFTLLSNFQNNICDEYSSIKTIGGCGDSGRCGIILENGMKLESYHPVVGEKLCAVSHDHYDEVGEFRFDFWNLLEKDHNHEK